MLIADINELKYQQEDAKKPNAEEEGEGKEDVTFLKLALKWVINILLQVSSTDCSVHQAWASVLDEVLNDFWQHFIGFYVIAKSMCALWLVNQLWFTVLVN